ncbi:MAG: prephenate dehydrogenase [Anaerolineae bacterium]
MNIRRVAIIGVDCITASIALGLKAQEEPPRIIGYDAEAVAAKLAQAQGAFDRVERKLDRVCKDADLVIVAVPLTRLRETFTAIAPHLQPGCLVTDTARLKAPVMHWAEELLPENVFFVGGHPILNPAVVGLGSSEEVEVARADLLTDALYCFTTPSGSSGAAIEVFAGLAKMLGAHPFFIDAIEHDGLQAGIEGLPDLLAIALLRATVDTPGWQEMRKFAGHRFAATTKAADDVHERHAAAFLNRENILGRLNVLLNELVHLRDLLAQDDAEPLEEVFATATESRARWIQEREQGLWGQESIVRMDHVPTAGEHFKHMLFGERPARRSEGADHPRKG